MASNYMLSVGRTGTATDELDLLDSSKHFIVANGVEFDHEAGQIRLQVLVVGSDADTMEANASNIQEKLNQASAAFVDGHADEYVTLGVARDTTSVVFYPVMGGTLAQLNEGTADAKTLFLVTLDVPRYEGRIVGYGAKVTLSATGNLSNGSATFLASDVTGDAPARCRFVLNDTSVSNVINRVYISSRSAGTALVTDWDPWVDGDPASGAGTAVNGTALGGTVVTRSLSTTGWVDMARCSMPAGALNQGRFHVYARVNDGAVTVGAPVSGSATVASNHVTLEQTAIAGTAAGGTAVVAAWSGATTLNSTLVAAVKAHKTTTRYAIGLVTAGTALTTVDTTEPHNLTTGDKVLIENATGVEPSIDGLWTATVTDTDTFTITTGTSQGGSAGSVRETFYETINQVPAGYLQIGYQETVNMFDEAQPALPLGFGRFSTAEADTWDQTKIWVYAKPAGASESGAKTWGWNGTVTQRAALLAEVSGVSADTGGLGGVTVAQGETILEPPAVDANTLLLGINASKDQTWQPLFGFEEQEDSTGLVLATKRLDEAATQPWAAIPNDYDFPSVAALVAIAQDPNPATYGLPAGDYAFRIQAVDATGNAGAPTSSINATTPRDGGAVTLSWAAGASPPVSLSHYRITFSFDGDFYVINTPDTTTSYTVTSLTGLATTDALPTVGTTTPNQMRALVGLDAAQGAAVNMVAGRGVSTNPDLTGHWHHVYLGTFMLPPQRGMDDGVRPDWAIDLQARNAGGPTATMQVDAIVLMSADEPGLLLEYPGLDLATAWDWHWERDAFERNAAWLEDGSNNIVRQITDVGSFELQPGDNVVSVVMEFADGKSTIGTGSRADLTVEYFPRFVHGKGAA